MSLDALKISRVDGELVPRVGKTSTLGLAVTVVPLTYGQSLTYDSFGKPVKSWTAAEKARLLSENLVELEGEKVGSISADDVLEAEAYSLSDVLESILLMSAMHRLYKDKTSEEGNVEALAEEESES
jgi:hypothetical protein